MEKCDFRPLEGRNRPRDCDFRNLRVKLYRIPKFSSKSVPWGPLSWPFEGIHVYTHVIRNPPRVSHDAICFLNHGFQIRNHLTLHAPTQVSYSTFSPYKLFSNFLHVKSLGAHQGKQKHGPIESS